MDTTTIIALPARPSLTAAILEEVGHDVLAQGATCDEVYFALRIEGADLCQLLLAALTSGDFVIVPRIRVRAIKPRLSEWPIDEAGILRNIDGVLLFADDGTAWGDEVVMLLAPAVVDAKSALRHHLLNDPNTTKAAAFAAVKQVCPRVSRHALEIDWSRARLDVGLPEHAPPGRPRRIIASR
jgi:hypothetical protein